MKLFEGPKAFFLRKRRWWLVAAGLAIVIVGHVLESREIGIGDLAATGARLTRSMHDTLKEQSPGVVMDRYFEAVKSHHVLCNDCGGAFAVADLAVTTVAVTPAVAVETWRAGGWFDRLLFAATDILILLILVGIWTDRTIGIFGRVWGTVCIVAFGPAIVALVFWLTLLLLILVTVLVGEVLSGIVLLGGLLGSAWKIGKLAVEALKHADELDERGVPFVRKMFGATPPAPPAATPSVPPPKLP